MVPEDGDSGAKPGPRAGSSAEDAFAPTIAPTSDAPTPPYKLPAGTLAANVGPEAGSDVTVAAPVAGTLPPLPEVSTTLYRTDREIARGGMGRIVAAEDRRLGRPVALKQLIDPTGEQVSRFQREALITARLQHPGIVPVYEAGRWPNGEPFFAMKLVSGRPLDKVIGEATELEDRLVLLPRLAAACDAIAYAHSQRIIHRDLKPGNVLIGDFGETVVIDWGLAKDLDSEDSLEAARMARPSQRETSEPTSGSSTLTVAGAVMGTPAYMAPEQARGEAVDQAADVFALGAMLYHLLAGAPPYAARTATDVIAAAALGKVVPLRERERRAPLELVAIVERAMAPIAQDRYPNASGLADELRRFLTGQLVAAHRYTAMQRVGRFVRKHRAAVVVSAIAIIGFAVGGTIAVRNVVHARDLAEQEGRIANTRKVAAERLIDYMFSDMKSKLGAIGRLDLMTGLGTEARRYFDRIAHVPGGMPREDQLRWAEALDVIGQAEHTKGKADVALSTWREARNKLAAIIESDRGAQTRRMRQMIAHLDYESGLIFQERGKLDEAIETFNLAKHGFDELRDEDPSAREVLLGAADTHDRLGDLLRNEGKIDQAFEEYSEAKTERERAASQGNGKVTDQVMALSTSHLKLASVYQNRGESATALEEYRTALRLRETLLEGQSDNVQVQEKVLEVQDQLAELQRQIGDEKAAIETYRRALPVTLVLVMRDPSNTEWKRQRGNMLGDLGFALIDSGSFRDGLAQLDQAIEVQKDLIARDPKSTRYLVDLSRSYTRTGDGLVDLARTDEGIARYQLSLEIRRGLVDRDATSVPFRRALAWAYAKLANAYIFKGEPARGLDSHEQALALRKQLVVESPSQGGFKNELASTEIELGKLVAARDAKRAAELISQGIARARLLVDGDPINSEWRETLTQGLLAQNALGKVTNDRELRRAALLEALRIAEAAAQRAPQNVQWSGLLAEVYIAFTEIAVDRLEITSLWSKARDILEPLAKDGRLPATRLPLLDRARARR